VTTIVTAAIAGRRQNRTKDVTIATFFHQDPNAILKYTIKDGLKAYPERYCLKRHLISHCYQIGCLAKLKLSSLTRSKSSAGVIPQSVIAPDIMAFFLETDRESGSFGGG
jgi:hypothetical protein